MTGNKKIVHFLSASDRINYGDLLFPIIFKKIAEENGYTFHNYGIVKSDLTFFGALPTKSYKVLLREINCTSGKLIIGGGEVFFADWKTLYGFISPFYAIAMKNIKISKIEKRIKFAKFHLSFNQVSIPFCPSKKELNNKIKIYYNSVGGSYPYGKNKKEIDTIKDALKDASLVSVRDRRTLKELQKLDIQSKIVPDSAILLSSMFSKKDIMNRKSFNIENSRYIFLQLGINKGPKDLEKFASKIKNLSQKLNLNVVLCPIGKAPGHEDHIILRKLQVIERDFRYIEPANIYDIMFLISNASLYLGTSLHGVITAQSFNVPFVGLNKNLTKVESYTTTWIGKEYQSLAYEEVEKIIDIYNEWNFNKIAIKNREQKELVKENIYSILYD
ncbi:polysaccharide pyruvyl transferase family protein [uncultured Christiangramia sp.]|uniref:polysaccharide pyruvyl transferase family protein n=1 Tax=uncultured Christiangramia sp. TaxID=503836 RepID=UPI00262C7AE9|nr:polysaccharide pyruvyl transferase family protein [uncultured Christiangramia sp.]